MRTDELTQALSVLRARTGTEAKLEVKVEVEGVFHRFNLKGIEAEVTSNNEIVVVLGAASVWPAENPKKILETEKLVKEDAIKRDYEKNISK